jgi:dipeptidase E
MRNIIALGGGGFSSEMDGRLDEYILKQARIDTPVVTFIATASGDSDNYIRRFYTAFCELRCQPRHISLFSPVADLERRLLRSDVVYVGGGNTRSMLAVWREWDVIASLKKCWEQGVVLAGVSAGAICWFTQGVTDSGGELDAIECLGLLDGSCCPHYDNELCRRHGYHDLLKAGRIVNGYGVSDGAALHFVDGELRRVVASQAAATAYRVGMQNGAIEESALPSDLLT